MKKLLISLIFFIINLNSFAQYTQVGNKLVGTRGDGSYFNGSAISFSADGKIALLGGYTDYDGQGAAWVYTFNGTNYVQVGNKLVGTGAIGATAQAISVSLSANGNVAMVGCSADNNAQGAAWIFTFNGSNYVQLGNKLVGTGAIGAAGQGTSVSLSADGMTALVGGLFDNSYQGAVWIYTFNGSNFDQAGNKLVGTNSTQVAYQGKSVSLSSDGKTALIGGSQDNDIGAVWIYTFNGSNYIQVGNKLVGTGSVGSNQGTSVSISADGLTALVGGDKDNSLLGAAWIYTFNGSNYVQVGSKLVGTGAIGDYVSQGQSVSLSTDGKTALVGGWSDNLYTGAIWIYTFNGSNYVQAGSKIVDANAGVDSRQGLSVFLSADGKTAFAGGHSSGHGAVFVYTFDGNNYVPTENKLVSSDNLSSLAYQGYSVSLSADGNIALVGGYADNGEQGAAWVYTFNGTNYVQAGNKLTGSDKVGSSVYEGYSVSLSADGKTALIGGYSDNSGQGAAWIYTFNGSNYVQFGNKLVGTGGIGKNVFQGSSVSLSANGETALIGGNSDNYNIGAAWIYTFNGSNYIQAGNKLVGADAGAGALHGISVSLSADGNTALVGGSGDNSGKGAAWIYTFNGSNYIQLGNKLSGKNAIGDVALQGLSVSLSANGKMALVGGSHDNFGHGAVWIYTFNGNNFTQLGNKMPGKDLEYLGSKVCLSADGNIALIGETIGAPSIYAFNGCSYVPVGNKLIGTGSISASVSLSADGKTALVGDHTDNGSIGAAWAYRTNTLLGVSLVTVCNTDPMITFSGANLTVGGPSLDLSTLFATDSPGIVSYNISGIAASLSGTNLTPIEPGRVTITVSISSALGFNAGSQTAIFMIAPNQTITGISTTEINNFITLYPNPTNGILNIQGNFDMVTITDVMGITMYIGNKSTFDLRSLNDGLYFVKITKGNISVVKRIIKNSN